MGKAWRLPALFVLVALAARAEPPLPPVPTRHVEDRAGLLPAAAADRLAKKLAAFEAESRHQVLLAIYPSLQGAVLEDFTVRTAESWRVGRKDLDDGAVLFVFVQERALRLEVGYGLEERIPDAIASRILHEVVVPRMRDDPAAALEAGLDAVFDAAQGRARSGSVLDPDVPYGEVPEPPGPGFHDDARLLAPVPAERVRAAVARFTADTGCPLALQIVDGPPPPAQSDPRLYAFRSHMRARIRKGDDTSEDAIARAMGDPGVGLFVFVTQRAPLEFTSGGYGGGACGAAQVDGVQRDVLWPRMALAPAEALLATVETMRLAHHGQWQPGPEKTLDEYLAERDAEQNARRPRWQQAVVAVVDHPRFPPAALACLLLGVALAIRLMGWRRFVDMLASHGGSGSTSGGRSYSSSGRSSSSSFSGGGGSFGGGGASARW